MHGIDDIDDICECGMKAVVVVDGAPE